MTKKEVYLLTYTALAIIFSIIQFPILPQGGSISIEILFLIIILLNFSVREFFISILIYTIFIAILGSYYFTFFQWLLDYPIALLIMIIPKLLMSRIKNFNKFHETLFIFLCFFLKLMIHTLTGVIFFANFAPSSQSVFIYSFLYNATFIIPTFIIVTILFFTVKSKSKSFIYLNIK